MKNKFTNPVMTFSIIAIAVAAIAGVVWFYAGAGPEEEREPTTEEGTTTIRVYFTTEETGVETCVAEDFVEREIPATRAVGRAALEQLLGGPNAEEQAAGFTTSINLGTELQDLRVEDGIAYADFNEMLDFNTGGSCLVTAIYTQIENTLLQFPTVDEVVVSRNGEVEDVLQP